MARELAPPADITPAANCGELIRVWQCTDHLCVMVDPSIFDDKIEGYGRLFAVLCVQFFGELLQKTGGEIGVMYSQVIGELRSALGRELPPSCSDTRLETVAKREELPLPPCALKDSANFEIARTWLYDPFGDSETKFSVVPRDNIGQISLFLLSVSSEVSAILVRSASSWEMIKYQILRFIRGQRVSVQSFIAHLLLQRALEYLGVFRDTMESKGTIQIEMDNQLLATLRNMGCPLDHVHEIDHAFACNKSTVHELAAALKDIGLTVKDPDEDGTWLECTEVRTPISMPERTEQLTKIAARFDAEYDGWGSACPSVKRR